jgi:hypothetical protein
MSRMNRAVSRADVTVKRRGLAGARDYGSRDRKSARGSYTVDVGRMGREEWSRILSGFNDANIYQTWEYGAVKWGEDNLVHVVLRESGQAVAAAQTWQVEAPIVGGGAAHVSMGPMWHPSCRAADPATIDRMIGVLCDEFVTRRKLLLRLYLYDREDLNSAPILQGLDRNEVRRTREPPDVTVILNLSPDLEQLRRQMRKEWRRHLRKAEKTDVEIMHGTDDQMFGALCELYHEMVTRKGFTDLLEDTAQLAEVQRRLPPAMKMRVFLCRHDGEIVGGQAISALGNAAIGLISATSNKDVELKLRSTYLCDWTAIQWLKEQGFAGFDLRGYDPDKYPGPSAYKAGLGGDIASLLGIFERSDGLKSSAVVRGGKAVSRLSSLMQRGTRILRRAFP